MGKLLVVYNDAITRGSVTALLAASGYESVEARDGLEALQVYRARRAEISLIIMDILLPRMDGITATKVLKATDSSAKVILVSGSAAPDPAQAQADALLPTPFRGKELLEVVQKILQDDRPLPWVHPQPTQGLSW